MGEVSSWGCILVNEFLVDKSFCVNIKERQDKHLKAKEELCNVKPSVEFFHVDRDNEDPQRGCFSSHQMLARAGIENGWKNILIFEDDIQFYKPLTDSIVKKVNKFIRVAEFDILFLGLSLGRIWLSKYPGFTRCRGSCTHAYILSQQGMEKLARVEYAREHIGIDTWYKKQLKGYSLFPMIARQRSHEEGESDISEASCSDEFWDKNYRRQYWSILANLHRSLGLK